MNTILSALINGVIVSALIAGAVWLGMLAASRFLNAATRYLVWWAALAVTAVLPLWYLPGRVAPPLDIVRSQPAHTARSLPATALPSVTQGASVIETPPANHLRLPLLVIAGRVPPWAATLWGLTTVIMLARLVISWVVLERRKLRAAEAPASLSARLAGWLAQCGLPSAKVRLAVSDEIATPMVAGARTILIPAPLLDALDPAELDQIGLHETAHLARGDAGALLLQRFMEALFPFHPVIRWIARRIDLEREIACDDFVVQATGSPRPYAVCLTHVAELTGGVRTSPVAAAAADERSHLSRRVAMLLKKTRHTGTRPLKARLATGVAALAALAWIAARFPGVVVFATPLPPQFPYAAPAPIPAPPAPQRAEQPPAPKPENPFRPLVPQPKTTIDTPAVNVQVIVRDPRNRFVTGLDRGNFRLFEEGVEQTITRVSTRDVPLSFGLVIDTSGSMRARFTQVQDAVRQLLAGGDPKDEFFVVQFDQEAPLSEGFTQDRAELQRRLNQLQPAGGTALADAVVLALRQMKQAHNPRKAILVITGASHDKPGSRPTAEILKEMIGRLQQELTVRAELFQTRVPVYAVSLEESDGTFARFLADLAEQTGGRHFTVRDTAAVSEAASRIGAEMRNVYTLEYLPTNAAKDGNYRKLQVQIVTFPGLPPLKVDFQAGYYAQE